MAKKKSSKKVQSTSTGENKSSESEQTREAGPSTSLNTQKTSSSKQTISYSSIAQKSQQQLPQQQSPQKQLPQQSSPEQTRELAGPSTSLNTQKTSSSKQTISYSSIAQKSQQSSPEQQSPQQQSQKNKKLSKRQLASKKQEGIDIIPQATTSRSIDKTDSLFSSLSISDSGNLTTNFAAKKYGNDGYKVQLVTNFFKIQLKNESDVYYHYNIEIVESSNNNNRKNTQKQPKSKKSPMHLHNLILETLFNKYEKVFQSKMIPVFDGNKNIYTKNKLNFNADNVNENDNLKWSNKLMIRDQEKEIGFIINLTTPEQSHCKSLSNLLSPNQPIMPVELQALDIIMRNGSRINKIALGQNFFLKSNDTKHNDKDIVFDLNNNNDVIKYGKFGYYQNAKILEKGIFYNVDRSINIFQYGGSLINTINNLCQIFGLEFNVKNKKDLNKIEEHIKTLKFKVLHLNYTKYYTINGLSRIAIKDLEISIDDDDGKKTKTTVLKYFNKKYPTIKLNSNLPAVKVGRDKFIPIEVCYLENNEVFKRKLDQKQQGFITKKSAQPPLERFRGILEHVKKLKDDSTINGVNYLDEYGISVDDQPLTVEGRVLSAPKIQYKDKELDVNNGSWNCLGHKFVETTSIGNNWAIINFSELEGKANKSSIRHDKVLNIVKLLIDDAKKKGSDLSTPSKIDSYFKYRGVNTLDDDLFKKLDSSIKLVVLLIPNSYNKIYNEIKTLSELTKGLITQCLNQKNWFRPNGQLISNIMLKINPKTSGVNHKINAKIMPNILKKESNLMIMGLDVTHPSVVDGFKKSVGAVVATTTENYDKVSIDVSVQEKSKKEIMSLKSVSKKLLDNYKKSNNKYPDRILMYRDGVGDGFFETVLNCELKAIQDACDEKNLKIKITYIMVLKRHNIRMYPENASPDDKPFKQNMSAGTVVDKDITSPNFFEFYLCSHGGAMGTSRASKYIVLYDDNDLSADELQKATYYLCHLYPRCTKSISIPPVVAYSHLLAKRGKAYLTHLDEANSGSLASSDNDYRELSEAERNKLNEKISVKPNINGRLFFI